MPRIETDAFYRAAVRRHGETALGVHWNSAESQELRFRVLRGLLPEDIAGLTLVDAGCGFGHLHHWLAAADDLPSCYIGLDVLESMVERARERTGCEILLRDCLVDPLPAADYYLCSGAMNTLTIDETRTFIARCYEAARRGFVFNLLHGRDYGGTFNYLDPERVRGWGEDLGARVEVLAGYLYEDFSVGLFRDVT
jgi:SAM-dependent methyltransferase